mmetsp:Transcript_3939/g.6975  ORF Transcript_3939/g.6975 Transcript_3939/m.6975 type:complete len:108 (-) Transcript_3939:628-951(-)
MPQQTPNKRLSPTSSSFLSSRGVLYSSWHYCCGGHQQHSKSSYNSRKCIEHFSIGGCAGVASINYSILCTVFSFILKKVFFILHLFFAFFWAASLGGEGQASIVTKH